MRPGGQLCDTLRTAHAHLEDGSSRRQVSPLDPASRAADLPPGPCFSVTVQGGAEGLLFCHHQGHFQEAQDSPAARSTGQI